MDTQKLLNAIGDENVKFCMIPTAALKEAVAKSEHPYVQQMPEWLKLAILSVTEGNAIGPIDKPLVLKYVTGTLDERQKWVLDRCDVRVIGLVGIGTQSAIA